MSGVFVSIHTPPQGRDINRVTNARNLEFQFTRPRRGAMPKLRIAKTRDAFQFTRPRRGAISCSYFRSNSKRFNSHAPAGARCNCARRLSRYHVSIHTPPQGRDSLPTARLSDGVFQFTRPRRGAMMDVPKDFIPVAFQFTRPRRGAIISRNSKSQDYGFNSHAPAGARSVALPSVSG